MLKSKRAVFIPEFIGVAFSILPFYLELDVNMSRIVLIFVKATELLLSAFSWGMEPFACLDENRVDLPSVPLTVPFSDSYLWAASVKCEDVAPGYLLVQRRSFLQCPVSCTCWSVTSDSVSAVSPPTPSDNTVFFTVGLGLRSTRVFSSAFSG